MTGRTTRQPVPPAGYGARAVSIDTLHGLAPTAADPPVSAGGQVTTPVAALSPQQVADRLALAHWPWGHQILVCSLAGGVGRTTVSGLLATVLAELSFAHIWPPIALAEHASHSFSRTAQRWDVVTADTDDSDTACTRSGAWVFTEGQSIARREAFSTIVIDAVPRLPSSHHAMALDPRASVLLLVRPDRASLAEAADVLVWMHDQQLIAGSRVVVLINHTSISPRDPATRAAATALATRCAGVHKLPFHPALGPGRPLPSGSDLPIPVRRVIARTALDLWGTATGRPIPYPARPVHAEEPL